MSRPKDYYNLGEKEGKILAKEFFKKMSWAAAHRGIILKSDTDAYSDGLFVGVYDSFYKHGRR